MASMLQVEGLTVRLPYEGELAPVVAGIDFEVGRGEAVGLVGESGSGKSMTARRDLAAAAGGRRDRGRSASTAATCSRCAARRCGRTAARRDHLPGPARAREPGGRSATT